MCKLGWSLRYSWLEDSHNDIKYEDYCRHLRGCEKCQADIDAMNKMSKVVPHTKVKEK